MYRLQWNLQANIALVLCSNPGAELVAGSEHVDEKEQKLCATFHSPYTNSLHIMEWKPVIERLGVMLTNPESWVLKDRINNRSYPELAPTKLYEAPLASVIKDMRSGAMTPFSARIRQYNNTLICFAPGWFIKPIHPLADLYELIQGDVDASFLTGFLHARRKYDQSAIGRQCRLLIQNFPLYLAYYIHIGLIIQKGPLPSPGPSVEILLPPNIDLPPPPPPSLPLPPSPMLQADDAAMT